MAVHEEPNASDRHFGWYCTHIPLPGVLRPAGDNYIASLAAFINKKQPELRGFDRRGLYRMMQFYNTYKNLPKVSPLVTQLSWANNLIILSSCKTDIEREFYLRLSIKERYSKRELERQIASGYFERFLLSKKTLLPDKNILEKKIQELMLSQNDDC